MNIKTKNEAKSGGRTLLASVMLSSPGPIVVGVGLLIGRSSTQLADFIRRTAELAAILVSWIIYRVTAEKAQEDGQKKERLERVANLCVGGAMCLGGAAMILTAFLVEHGDKGNVIPGLIIAVLGVTTNTWFWFRYRKLNIIKPNAILAAQSKLFRAKSLVDACVTAALAAVAIAPASSAAYYMDFAGTVVVAVYLLASGVSAVYGDIRARGKTG